MREIVKFRKLLRIIFSVLLIAIGVQAISSTSASAAACVPTESVVANTYTFDTFTATGTCTWTVPYGVSAIDILIVGAGGGGGNDNGGGGGGGQVIESMTVSVIANEVESITVGLGGLPGCASWGWNTTDSSDPTTGCKGTSNTGGNTGGSSSFVSTQKTITSLGGSGAVGRGRSGGCTGSGWDKNGFNGGGLGIGGYQCGYTSSPNQGGYNGGTNNSSDTTSGGGGGSNGAGGGTSSSTVGGNGGAGITSTLTGGCYGGGGGGGAYGVSAGTATCGGAAGLNSTGRNNATSNTGGGGGGGTNVAGVDGGTGGSGLVVIRINNTLSNTNTSISLAGNVSSANKRTNIVITAAVTQPGTVTFYFQNRRIANCINVQVTSLTATCNWKPIVQGIQILTATLTTSNGYRSSTGTLNVSTLKRSNAR